MSLKINPINHISNFSVASAKDTEYEKIAQKLAAMGYEPTGNKTADKAKLHQLELEQAKTEIKSSGNATTISASKFLTISATELERLKEQIFQLQQSDRSAMEAQRIGATQQALMNMWQINNK